MTQEYTKLLDYVHKTPVDIQIQICEFIACHTRRQLDWCGKTYYCAVHC